MGRFKLGICEWAFPMKGPYSFKLAKQLGLDGVELDLGEYEDAYPLSNKRIQDSYKECSELFDIEFPSIALNALCTHGMNKPMDSNEGRIAIETIEKGIQVAVSMNIKVVQLPSFIDGDIKTEEDFNLTVKMLSMALKLASDKGISIAYENAMSTEQNLKMIELIDTDNLKIMFDTQNPYLEGGFDVPEMYAALAPHVEQIHLKDGKDQISSSFLGEGDTKFYKTADTIKKSGYSGWLLLENYYNQKPLSDNDSDVFTVLEKDISIGKRVFTID